MQVTQEDGGRLNAFAKEPRMELIEPGSAAGPNRILLISGLVLVLGLVALAAGIS
ncbi:MAG: ssl1498 family light-harvesting-like protein [Synechococcaceae cyanobacterium]|nr:ssl1498 family light-harvesting-like protein [Synechococcaceae cyanobacterium]